MTNINHDPLHPIVTVLLPGQVIAQGPTVEEVDPRRPNVLPIDMHGKLAVDIGGGLRAVGYPVRPLRREEATHAPPVVAALDAEISRAVDEGIYGKAAALAREQAKMIKIGAESLTHTERGRICEAREPDGELIGVTLGLGAGMHLHAGPLDRKTVEESGFHASQILEPEWWLAVFTPSWSRVYAPIQRDDGEALLGFLSGVIGGAK